MRELILRDDQLELLADLVEQAIIEAREDCVWYEPGSETWNRLVAHAKELQGLLSELEGATAPQTA